MTLLPLLPWVLRLVDALGRSLRGGLRPGDPLAITAPMPRLTPLPWIRAIGPRGALVRRRWNLLRPAPVNLKLLLPLRLERLTRATPVVLTVRVLDA
eukprot:scaffold57706_cov82-Phaeocystis_antarctica.AAC.9